MLAHDWNVSPTSYGTFKHTKYIQNTVNIQLKIIGQCITHCRPLLLPRYICIVHNKRLIYYGRYLFGSHHPANFHPMCVMS
jgi:hypothetical protein